MPGSEKLERIRKEISPESGAETSEERRSRTEQIDKIVGRIKKKEEPRQAPVRLESLRQRVEGKASYSQFMVSSELVKATDARIRAIGSMYTAFEAPLSKLAEAFSTLPAAAGLSRDLAASGIAMSADAYLMFSTTAAFACCIAALVLASTFQLGLYPELGLGSTALFSLAIAVLVLVISGVCLMLYPSLMASSRAAAIDKELPFALRHLSTQVKAGTSFQQAIASVADGNYGLLSEELKRVLRDLDGGLSTEDALLALNERTKSKGLRQATLQIVRALRSGGSLSEIISAIAEEVSFEMRMRVRDFTEKLNLISVVFIMVAVVAPVIITITAAVTRIPMIGGGSFDDAMITGAFLAILILTLVLVFVIKRMEPM